MIRAEEESNDIFYDCTITRHLGLARLHVLQTQIPARTKVPEKVRVSGTIVSACVQKPA